MGGIVQKEIPELDDIAEELRDIRKAQHKLNTEETDAMERFGEALKKHGFTSEKKAYSVEFEREDGSMERYDAFIDRPEARAYLKKHKEPKVKAKDKSEEGAGESK